MKDDKEVFFRINFDKQLSEQEQRNLWLDFVNLMEKHGLLYNGGEGPTYITGGISHINDDFFNEAKVKSLLLQWVNKTSYAAKIDFNVEF